MAYSQFTADQFGKDKWSLEVLAQLPSFWGQFSGVMLKHIAAKKQ